MADEMTATNTETAANTATETATAGTTETAKTEQTGLTQAEIEKLIQSTVDKRTAEYGKKLATLQEENKQLKKANMTAEQLAQADKEEFERQKAEVELGKRQLHAHRVVASAGYGNDADAVVDIILGDTDEKTDERLKNFKTLIDKIVADTVAKTFEKGGRNPNSGGKNNGNEDKKENNIAAILGKQSAEAEKKAAETRNYYINGGKK